MRLSRLLAVARKEAIQLRRDPRSMVLAFVLVPFLPSWAMIAATLVGTYAMYAQGGRICGALEVVFVGGRIVELTGWSAAASPSARPWKRTIPPGNTAIWSGSACARACRKAGSAPPSSRRSSGAWA